MSARSFVTLVDDSDSARESISDLLRQSGFLAQAFESAEAFLTSDAVASTQCLILDVSLPRMSGPDLQEHLKRTGCTVPIVFITGHPDESLSLRLMSAGAVACLFKPVSDLALLAAVNSALAMDGEHDDAS